MSDAARKYLSPPRDAFWKWSDSGEVIDWANGKTIIFRRELRQVLEAFHPDGLPPLGAVLLLVAATRDNWCGSGEADILLETCRGSHGTPLSQLADTLAALDRVHYLESELRSSPDAKRVLVDLVFQHRSGRLHPRHTHEVLRLLEDGIEEAIFDPPLPMGDGGEILNSDLALLNQGLKHVDPDCVRMRLATGLDGTVAAADLDLPTPAGLRELVRTLQSDEKLSGVARLARQLMAAASLPREVSEPDDLPTGGVSDISNRGSLDRLLISELAHDPTTLAVRVALNEALYYRREAPPFAPARGLSLWLECGIRCWGAPRVFATAAALAVGATAHQHASVRAWRAEGASVVGVDLTTRDGLLEHLSALQPEPHPAAALPSWIQQTAGDDHLETDIVLVTTDEVMQDVEFRQAIDTLHPQLLYVATVNRDGRFRLATRSAGGGRVLRDAKLELSEVLSDQAKPESVVDNQADRDMPAIMRVDPFPLRLSHTPDFQNTWQAGSSGILVMTQDQRLMYWDRLDQGALQIRETLPRGALLWAETAPVDHQLDAVIGHAGAATKLSLVKIDLAGPKCEVLPLDVDVPGKPDAVVGRGARLLMVFNDQRRVASFNRFNGTQLNSLQLPSWCHPYRGRVFRTAEGGWCVLTDDLRIEPVFDSISPDVSMKHGVSKKHGVSLENGGSVSDDGSIDIDVDHQPVAVFEHASSGELIGLFGSGAVVKSSGSFLGQINCNGLPPVLTDLSRSGNRMIVSTLRTDTPGQVQHQQYLVTLQPRFLCQQIRGSLRHYLASEFRGKFRPRSFRHRFTRIGVDELNRLVLMTRKGQRWVIAVSQSQPGVVRLREEENIRCHRWHDFKGLKLRRTTGFSLRVAEWSDGSRAILDSRGLLHLRSGDPAVPEATLTLTETPLAIWNAARRAEGPVYYTGHEEESSTVDAFHLAVDAFARRL